MDTEQFTDEEIAALPQTMTVMNTPKLVMDEHVWLQQGYTIIDQCCDGQAIAIPNGRMLIKKDGRYDLVDEVR